MRLSAAELCSSADLAQAREVLERFHAPASQQAQTRLRMLEFIREHPLDAHLRTCVPGHLTASALVIDGAGERALLTFHRKLERWLQLGGHCDGDANLASVALRECEEESGIQGLAIDPIPVDLDVHWIPARRDEPGHWHLDTRFLVYAPVGALAARSDESIDLCWFRPDELASIATDDSVQRLFGIAFGPRDD